MHQPETLLRSDYTSQIWIFLQEFNNEGQYSFCI